MRSCLLIIITILLSLQAGLAQNDNVTLLAQSADGKAVKLFWSLKSWNSSITGFDIRRKEGMQNWVKLNTAPVLPAVATKRKFSVSGNNLYEESLVKAKMYKLLKNHDLQETDNAKFLQKLNNDARALPDLNRKMAEDYDVAMITGFGYIDHTATKKITYEYGLFIQGTDKLLAQVSWNHGEIPDLDVVQELTSKASPGSKGIKVMWVADTPKMKRAHVAGFNIYRNGIRLNTTRITAEAADDFALYTWFDKYADAAASTQYSIAAESVFDIEGIIRSYAYDPADHPKEYKKPEVTEITALGYYFKDGTGVKWNFPKEYEHFIKGFYVEKDNMPAGYKLVSGLLDPSERSFTDKTQTQVNGYIKVRVRALYKDRTDIPGIERLYAYLPVDEPPVPQNVKVKGVASERKVTAVFTWDAPAAGDSVTDYYRVYAWDAASNKLLPISDQPIKGQSFSYQITHGTAGIHKFCITAVTKVNTESPFSDTLTLQTPSLEMPSPVIRRITPGENDRATIEWQYTQIPDLSGFRLFQNGKIIADETVLKKDTREFVTGKLDEGASYEFLLLAVSERGVTSDNSVPFHVVVNQTSK